MDDVSTLRRQLLGCFSPQVGWAERECVQQTWLTLRGEAPVGSKALPGQPVRDVPLRSRVRLDFFGDECVASIGLEARAMSPPAAIDESTSHPQARGMSAFLGEASHSALGAPNVPVRHAESSFLDQLSDSASRRGKPTLPAGSPACNPIDNLLNGRGAPTDGAGRHDTAVPLRRVQATGGPLFLTYSSLK